MSYLILWNVMGYIYIFSRWNLFWVLFYETFWKLCAFFSLSLRRCCIIVYSYKPCEYNYIVLKHFLLSLSVDCLFFIQIKKCYKTLYIKQWFYKYLTMIEKTVTAKFVGIRMVYMSKFSYNIFEETKNDTN